MIDSEASHALLVRAFELVLIAYSPAATHQSADHSRSAGLRGASRVVRTPSLKRRYQSWGGEFVYGVLLLPRVAPHR